MGRIIQADEGGNPGDAPSGELVAHEKGLPKEAWMSDSPSEPGSRTNQLITKCSLSICIDDTLVAIIEL